jgi:hypothetical protein
MILGQTSPISFNMKLVPRLVIVTLFLLLLVTTLTLANEEATTTATTEGETENSGSDAETSGAEEESSSGSLEEELAEPAYAVLYPSFITTLGVLVFFTLSRFIHFLPYTAVMFIFGTLIGIAVAVNYKDTHIHQTVVEWQDINSEVLLLVFLPGLIFKDALGQNVHLFSIGLLQMIIFAFPLVLAGTVLTALVGFYIFPYGWSFNLAMTFGSILSATDPVAVAALLEEVGKP